jgi:hypothetical protein
MRQFHVKHFFILSLISLLALPALAQKMYRCPGAGGSTTFTDTPCPTGSGSVSGNEISVKPSGGAAPAQAKPDPQTRGAMDSSLGKLSAQDEAMLKAEEAKRAEANRIAVKKNECAAKQRVLDSRSGQSNSLSEQDRKALAALTADVQANCR